jgi:hypothetical protein
MLEKMWKCGIKTETAEAGCATVFANWRKRHARTPFTCTHLEHRQLTIPCWTSGLCKNMALTVRYFRCHDTSKPVENL